MKRKFALIALALSLVLLVSACTPKAPEPTTAPEPTAAAEVKDAVEEAKDKVEEKVEEVKEEAEKVVEEVKEEAGKVAEDVKEAAEEVKDKVEEKVEEVKEAVAPAGKAKTLKMAITASETSSWYEGGKVFKQIVEEKTNGRFVVDLYPNEQLASGNQQRGVEMVYTGESDVDLHSTMIHSNIEPKLAAISMPFAYKSLEEVDAKLINNEEAMAAVAKLVEDKGIVLLGIGENGFRQLTNSKHVVQKPEDLDRLKIRVPNIALNLDIFKALGADPTAMAFGEVYTALQQGTIDGQENPLDTIRSNNIQEVQKYMSMWNYSYDPIILTVSKNLWDSLSDEDKAIFQDAGLKAMEEQRNVTRERNVALEKEFADAGIEVTYLTDDEKQAFKDKLTDLIKTYEEKLGKELLTTLGYYE